ncbi:MAG: PaaI family thioesterase [Promethearchaeota archaeon]
MNSLDVIKKKFENDAFAKNFGIILDDLTEDEVKMHMELKPELNNFHGRPHGGAIYALADAAFSIIGNNQNNVSVALNCAIHYHTSPEPGSTLYVRGTRIKQTRRIGTYYFDLYTLENGSENKIATMISTLYRTGKPHDPNLEVK